MSEKDNQNYYIDDMPEHEYHDKAKGYSSSDLKTILKTSPYHFKKLHDQPPPEPTDAMCLGSAVHCLVFRPDHFDQEIAVRPDIPRRSALQKERHEQFERDNKDKVLITASQEIIARAMADSVRNYGPAEEYVHQGTPERSFFFRVPTSEVDYRSRIDNWIGNNKTMVEFKTTKSADPISFSRDIANLKYHVSLAHYNIGIEQVLGIDITEIQNVFIVVEKTFPFNVEIYHPSEKMLHQGFQDWIKAHGYLEHALETDEWPSYTPDEGMIIDMPIWSYTDED